MTTSKGHLGVPVTFAVILLLLAAICSCQTAVNGNWSEWGVWLNCSASCGTGNITRYRTCTNPSPEIGGAQCNGTAQESKQCDTNVTCPSAVNGNWSEWGVWLNCSATCGTGNIRRYRTCTNPSPENGGAQCNGTAQESNVCDTNVTCPVVNGNWSEWGAWLNCSASCGTGNITRYRTCTNPSPENGGAQCNGTAQESKQCDSNVTCSVHGGWSDWASWGSCSVSCGAGGEQVRSRSCDNPPPSNGGVNCEGESSETRDCDAVTQPSCCTWSEWGPWGACAASPCSGGLRLRSRNRVGDEVQCSTLQGDFIDSQLCIARCS